MSSSLFPYAGQVEETLRAANRRRLLVEAAEQLAWAFGIFLTGFAFTLLFGTAFFGWAWMTALAAAGLVVALVRLRGRILSRYRVAQLLDRKLSLSDALSTAHFLLSSDFSNHDQVARFQLEQANRVAATVRVQDAFPFKAKRTWAICGALAAVTFGLFALRYLRTQSLSLRPPLVAFQMPPVMERLQESLRPKPDHLQVPALPRRYPADPTAANKSQEQNNSSLPSEASEPAGSSDRNGDLTRAQAQKAGKGDQQAEGAKSEARAGNQPSSQGESSDKTAEGNQQQAGTQNPASAKEQPSNGQGNSPGLMNRMKDALSNMMAKMRSDGAQKQQGQRSEQSQETAAKNNQSASANATPKQGQQSNQGEARSEDSNENENAEGQAQGQTSERPQNSQGRTNSESAQKGSDAQSGVGRQDGDKAIRDAEQAQAMGKLAELIGKRSANLTGEMTVETPSGKQQLKTAYSQRSGRHSDSGGEINRNEIPLIYQQYVREYMEQVRKQQNSKP